MPNIVDLNMRCFICGANVFGYNEVLCSELIVDWQLNEDQTEYVNIQQGCYCQNCGSNVRTILLAKAIIEYFQYHGTLLELLGKEGELNKLSFLEINEAGNLSKYLSQLPNHRLLSYPEIDIMNINMPDCSVDCILHSDTLEHIADSVLALQECYRILKPGGVLFFTIPIIHEKLTKKRHNLSNSYHGVYKDRLDDYIVYTEYGADFYLEIMKAGFDRITLTTMNNIKSFAITCYKPSAGISIKQRNNLHKLIKCHITKMINKIIFIKG